MWKHEPDSPEDLRRSDDGPQTMGHGNNRLFGSIGYLIWYTSFFLANHSNAMRPCSIVYRLWSALRIEILNHFQHPANDRRCQEKSYAIHHRFGYTLPGDGGKPSLRRKGSPLEPGFLCLSSRLRHAGRDRCVQIRITAGNALRGYQQQQRLQGSGTGPVPRGGKNRRRRTSYGFCRIAAGTL